MISGYSDYEIANEYPHVIRRIDTKQVVSEHIDGEGYYRLNLRTTNGQTSVQKHKIIANTFIHNPDPEHLTRVDHIDRNRTNNHIDNLRFVTPSQNADNKSSHRQIPYNFVPYLPDDAIRILHFRQDTLKKKIYYSLSENRFYLYLTDNSYRVLHQNTRHRLTFACVQSINNKQIRLYNHEVADQIDIYSEIDDGIPEDEW